jgi:hypothetical protein
VTSGSPKGRIEIKRLDKQTWIQPLNPSGLHEIEVRLEKSRTF